MKFVNFGQKLNLFVIILSLGAQLSMIAGALVPAVESAGVAASRAWQAASRIPSRVPQRGYSTIPTARVEQMPENTVRVEPRATAARYATARSMMSTGLSMGRGAQAGKSMGMSSMFGTRGFASQARSDSQLTREEIISRLNAGVKDFSGFDLSNLDLSKIPFLFVNVNFSGANFTNANLRESKFTNCDFTGANFTNANLVGTDFLGRVKLTNADFAGANLSSSNLGLPGHPGLSKEQKQQWTKTHRDLLEKKEHERQDKKAQEKVEHKPLTKRTRADVEYMLKKREGWSWLSQKTGFDLREKQPLDLSYSDLRGVDLKYLDLSKAELTGSDLTGANLTGTILYEANLTGVNLTDTILLDVNFKYANLTEANLTSAKSFIPYATLGVNFEYANLTSADCSNADLRSANFRGADLTNTNFTNADLTGATDADLSEAQKVQWKPSGQSEQEQSSGSGSQQQGRSSSSMNEPEAVELFNSLIKDPRVKPGMQPLSNNATIKEINTRFWLLSQAVHPDKNPDNPKATQEFQKLAEARDILIKSRK